MPASEPERQRGIVRVPRLALGLGPSYPRSAPYRLSVTSMTMHETLSREP